MARENQEVVGQLGEASEGRKELCSIPSRQIRAPDALGEERIARDQELLSLSFNQKADASRSVAWRMDDDKG